jgi:hypothetical protein
MVYLAMLLILAGAASAQIIYGQPTTGGSRIIFTHWSVEDSSGKQTLDQQAFPINAMVPISEGLEARFFVAQASNDLEQTGGDFSVSGLSDLRLQLNQALANDQILLSVGANIPTGKEKLSLIDEWPVMSFISLDYLSLPIKRLGEGPGFNALIGAATTSGQIRYGATVMYQLYGTFNAYDGAGDYNPGDLFSISANADTKMGASMLSASVVYGTYGTDMLDDAKVFKQSSYLELRLGNIYQGNSFTLESNLQYLIRGRNTRYDSSEVIYDRLKIYGNEFSFFTGMTFTAGENTYLIPSIQLILIGSNEFDFGNSSIFAPGIEVRRGLGENIIAGAGFKLFTGSADGGDIDLSGYQLTASLQAQF